MGFQPCTSSPPLDHRDRTLLRLRVLRGHYQKWLSLVKASQKSPVPLNNACFRCWESGTRRHTAGDTRACSPPRGERVALPVPSAFEPHCHIPTTVRRRWQKRYTQAATRQRSFQFCLMFEDSSVLNPVTGLHNLFPSILLFFFLPVYPDTPQLWESNGRITIILSRFNIAVEGLRLGRIVQLSSLYFQGALCVLFVFPVQGIFDGLKYVSYRTPQLMWERMFHS